VRITPNELALVTAGIAALTALVTLWNGRTASRTQLRISDDQRAEAQRDRLWQARSEAYVDALWLIRWWQRTFFTGSTELSARELRDSDREESWDQLLAARINAFGSAEVRSAFADLDYVFLRAEEAHDVVHGHAEGDLDAARADLEERRVQATRMGRILSDRVRAELQAQPVSEAESETP